jgi:hypothetical protein
VGGKTIVCNDCPASLMPNGKILVTAAEFMDNDWGSPILFFEYDPVANTMSQAPTPSNNAAKLYWSRLMLLPTGQVLFSPSSTHMQCYTPDGGPHHAWRPTISSIIPHGIPWFTRTFTLFGTKLNGLSQANMYGDDCYPATNYPLVRLTHTITGAVHFCRTHDFSTMGVATGAATHSARFTVPNIPDGEYQLCVIANGISSHCRHFHYRRPRKPEIIDSGVKREFEHLGKEIYEGDPWDRWQWVVDPEVIELKAKVKSLENSVRRLSSMIETKELPRVGKAVAKEAAAREKKARSSTRRSTKDK